ncbi:hypothetical protein [Streptomyces sp. DSM 40750]|uniref:hypothetical protein n=1 Tax=Streptomyces sp. DSM 40750 TaxID=2801030 RepID=UPI00214D11B4|nr:hypothetical protein [Streptomyces sp. DSM 40750]UUU20110.1 hypothetical protein JIX55_07200 [Streptomyces sp. DSM 40750]
MPRDRGSTASVGVRVEGPAAAGAAVRTTAPGRGGAVVHDPYVIGSGHERRHGTSPSEAERPTAPTTSVTDGSDGAPGAADGTDADACFDGRCEIAVSKPMSINVDSRFAEVRRRTGAAVGRAAPARGVGAR